MLLKLSKLLPAKENTMTDRLATAPQGASPTQSSARSKSEEAIASPNSLADQARAAGQDLKEKARDIADNSAEALKGHAADLAEAAKDIAGQATGKLKEAVSDRASSSAEYVGTLAETIRRAAREFDAELPLAGRYIRKAADQVEGVSDSIKNGNLNDLVRSAQTFARRQPTAFLGLAVLAGFGLVRFLKSSADNDDGARATPAAQRSATSQGYRNEFTH
jgi:hypothetical protein